MRKFENLYYYSFYLLTSLVHKINKRDLDGAFTALIWLSIPIGLNLLSLIFFFKGIEFRESKSIIYLISILIFTPVVAINYYLLMRNNRQEEIAAYFNEKTNNKKSHLISVIILVLYFLLSFAIVIYQAMMNREQNM